MILCGKPFSMCGMGLFTTEEEWIHPVKCESTYELILVSGGRVYIEEEGVPYALEKGNLLLLTPGKTHGGYQKSEGHTSFYWIHFSCPSLPFPLPGFMERGTGDDLFRRLLHINMLPDHGGEDRAESVLSYLLFSLSEQYGERTKQNRLFHEVVEWIRINATASLRAEDCAKHFGYSTAHLCRILQREAGIGTRAMIDRMLLSRAKDQLLNSGASVKEIAALLGFPSPNTFLHFFRYHEKETPLVFRNRYALTHMNKK
ncbi:MAG: helix-turn-helix transcriptional regulator [Clostridia bacterium]|nr:helix-turn-helix transcriptional regulator [Clostridia bacterium]